MDGIFVIGADTNVGKTILSAGLMKLSQGSRKLTYWKPIQTGTVLSDDTTDVKTYTELGPECFMEPAYRFAEPLAPRHAAQKWNKTIDLDVVVDQFKNRPDKSRFMIVEGAGGLLVPINDNCTLRELVQRLGLPVIIAAEDRIGAINHTVLTIEACRQAGISILGVVLAKAKGNLGNAESIAHFGKVEVLAEIPHYEDVRTVVAQIGAHPRLRKLMGVPSMPV
jgi:dethiobiotin synthase